MTKSLAEIQRGDRLRHSRTGILIIAAEDSYSVDDEHWTFAVVNRCPVDCVLGPGSDLMEVAEPEEEVVWPETLEDVECQTQ